MIVKKGNVERIVSDGAAKDLLGKGFAPLAAVEETGKKEDISKMKVEELRVLAAEKGIEAAESLNKQELLKVLKDVREDD